MWEGDEGVSVVSGDLIKSPTDDKTVGALCSKFCDRYTPMGGSRTTCPDHWTRDHLKRRSQEEPKVKYAKECCMMISRVTTGKGNISQRRKSVYIHINSIVVSASVIHYKWECNCGNPPPTDLSRSDPHSNPPHSTPIGHSDCARHYSIWTWMVRTITTIS